MRAPFTVKRTMLLDSAHQAYSGSDTDFLPAFDDKPKIGASPFGEKNRMLSRKSLGRSSVPQSPVPRRPAMPDIAYLMRKCASCVPVLPEASERRFRLRNHSNGGTRGRR